MQIATLITAPGAAGLPPAEVDALRRDWSGEVPRWLAPDEAADIALPKRPPEAEIAAAGEALRARGIDLAVQPAEGRRKRMLLADMDSTMIEQECIDELADMAGAGAAVREITARAMNGELDFEGALLERVALLKGLDAGVIDKVLAERISDAPGGATLVATMRAQGAHTVLVSGGFTAFSERVAAHLGFDETRANVLLERDGRLLGDVARPILGSDAKIRALEEITARLGLSEADVIAVGDGANDLGMLGRAGLGVALHAKPSVAARASIRIDHGDLTALLYLQGYASDAFVTV